ncbi:biopolymer transporter ExbD [bacterium BD-1]|nr:biopolymer transporter ExbD [Ottowia caeni]
MKFQARRAEEPEINLIPFIDVLLVILIFLMLTTTYSKFTEMQLTLPVANADAQRDRPKEVIVAVAADGRYMVNREPLAGQSVDALASALRGTVAKDGILIISADAMASHQSVISVMEAARREGLMHITFAARNGNPP